MAQLIDSTKHFIYDAYDWYLWTLSISGKNSKLISNLNFKQKFLLILDSRTKGWLLVDSPTPTVIYIMIYLFIVWAGPKAMKKYVTS